MPTYGLGSLWRKVEDTLKDLIPIYDKINRIISLGQDLRLRIAIAKAIHGKDLLVLDAGCGPGTMSKLILRSTNRIKQIILLDPLKEMLKQSKRELDVRRSAFVQAVFEYLPFRSSVFDAAVSTFALRDAFDLNAAVAELSRVVKGSGGVVLILDLGKPKSRLLQAIIGVYWRILAPLLASAYIGKGGLVYGLLYYTYIKLPTNPQLKKMLQGLFTHIDLDEKMLGGVILIRATK